MFKFRFVNYLERGKADIVANTMAGTPSNYERLGKVQRNCKRGDLDNFGLIRGKLRVFFMFSWEGGGWQGLLGPFLVGAVPPLLAMYSLFVTRKRLEYSRANPCS